MKKRILALLLTAAMVVSMTACAKKEEAPAADTQKTEDTTAEAPADDSKEGTASDNATAEPAKKSIKVGMVTDVGGIHDQSFNQTSWEGLEKAAQDLGIEVTYLESKNDADYKTNMETLVDEDCDLIVSVGYMLAEATEAAAKAYPDQKFAIIDSTIDLPNVASLMFEQAQASYLVGVAAAKMTKTDNVGVVIGMSTGPMNEFGYGYLAGVKDTKDSVKVQQYNANNFADPSLGKTATVDMKTKGADIVYHAAGGTGNGVIEACKEQGIYAIGVDKDQSSLAPDTVITSAMKRVDIAAYDVAKSVLDGTYKAGIHVYGLKDGGVDIAPTQDLLSEEAKMAIEAAKIDIIDGKIEVPKDQASFEAKYGPDLYELD